MEPECSNNQASLPTPTDGAMTELDFSGTHSPLNLGRAKAIARRQWWVVLVLGLVAMVGAAGYAELRPKSYAASIAVYTGIPASAAGQTATSTVGFPDPTLAARATQVTGAAASAAGLPTSKVSLSAVLSPDGSQVLLTATEPTPSQARQAVMAAAKAYVTVWTAQLDGLATSSAPQLRVLRNQLQSLEAKYSAGGGPKTAPPVGATGASVPAPPLAVEIQVVSGQYSSLFAQEVQYQIAAQSVRTVQSGAPPVASVAGGKKRLVLIALGAGLIAGCGIALARDLLRDRLSDPAELPELAELPLLAELPTTHKGAHGLLLSSFQGRLGEASREMRTALAVVPRHHPLKTLLVTSAGNGEGKSFTAANLAVASALSGARTVLVCSDLRHPSIEAMFGAQPSLTGLPQQLTGQTTRSNGAGSSPGAWHGALDLITVSTPVERLTILPSGPLTANPAEVLGSQPMTELVGQLRESFDMVIFDSPPVLAVADALVLSHHADGVLLVVASGRSTKGQVRRALSLLERSHAHMVGFVLNRAAHSGLRSFRYPSSKLNAPGNVPKSAPAVPVA